MDRIQYIFCAVADGGESDAYVTETRDKLRPWAISVFQCSIEKMHVRVGGGSPVAAPIENFSLSIGFFFFFGCLSI